MNRWLTQPLKLRLTLFSSLFVLSACGTVPDTPSDPTPVTLAARAVQGDDGLLSLAAASFSAQTPRERHSWRLENGTTLTALPDVGATLNTGFTTSSPRLDYQVSFVRAGTHYLWIYGQAAARNPLGSDSLHVGLDGRALTGSSRISGLGSSRGWTNKLMSGGVARLEIPKPGPYTLNVWMREDGVRMGALALTPDPKFRPTQSTVPGATPPAPAPSPVPPMTARAADAFVDSVGVNTHLHYTDTVYSRFNDLIKPKLLASSVRHVRDGAYTYGGVNRESFYYARLRELAAAGVRFNLITSMRTRWGETTDFSLLDDLYGWADGAVESFEGVNEPDIQGVEGWTAQARAVQRTLYKTVRNEPSLGRVKVLGPSPVWEPGPLGDLSAHLDYGNAHTYPGGMMPLGSAYGQSLDTNLAKAAQNSGSKPVVVTETGYHNALKTTGTHPPVSESATAVYLPRLLLAYFNRGVKRTYLYELIDTWPDPNRTDQEAAFGLLRNDGSEKPAFVAVKTLLKLLEDPGPAFDPGSLRVAVTGGSSVQKTLLKKRDGTFYLALWLETPSWDREARREIDVDAQPLTITVGEAAQRVTRYAFQPDGSASATALTLQAGRLELSVDDTLTLLEFAPR